MGIHRIYSCMGPSINYVGNWEEGEDWGGVKNWSKLLTNSTKKLPILGTEVSKIQKNFRRRIWMVRIAVKWVLICIIYKLKIQLNVTCFLMSPFFSLLKVQICTFLDKFVAHIFFTYKTTWSLYRLSCKKRRISC